MLVITDISALDFYRQRYPLRRAPGDYAGTVERGIRELELAEWGTFAYRESDVWSMAPTWVTPDFLAPESGVLHVLTRSAQSRCYSKTVRPHVYAGELRPDMLYRCSREACVASPEFAFLSMAVNLGLAECVALGFELCGIYSFAPSLDRGLRSRSVPLTNVSKLESFLARTKGARGTRHAERALAYVLERSASPMETTVAMLMCLPYRYGGYGLPPPKMNYPLELSSRAKCIAGKAMCYLDICWPEYNLLVEYNGGFDHTQRFAQDADRARINAITEMGYEVIELTFGQVLSLEKFEAIVMRVAARLGKRIPPAVRGRIAQRMQLRSDLLAWNKGNGRHRG